MSGLVSQATREQIRAANDIIDVIGASVPLKRRGAAFVALCPFHKEKTPSFQVNPQRQIFYCFGCHKGGDVFTFLMEFENLSFPEALRRLAERAKIPLEFEASAADAPSRHLKDKLLEIHEQIAQRWQNALANEASGQIARDYLAKRGVPSEAVQLFRIGYAPDLWDDTVNWAKSKGHDPGVVEKAGLIVRKEGTEHCYDRFRGRLMFPICDEQGRVIAFSGRILAGDEKTAKYVNSPETPIFIKSKVFFGLDKSKRALLDAKCAVICEGQLDLIACFMGGVQNVVAPQGTAFTADHARILKRFVEEVVLCFDSDAAGQNAAVRALDHLLAFDLAVRVAVVPAPHDPDSFIKAQGGAAFKELIERAPGFFEYYLNRLCSLNDITTDKGRLAVLRDMAEAVEKSGNSVLVENHARRTALRLGVSPEAVRAEFTRLSRAKTRPPEREEDSAEAEPEVPAPPPHEAWLLKLVLLNDDLAGWTESHLQEDWVQHPIVRQILSMRLKAHREGTWLGVAAFLDEVSGPEARNLVTEATVQDRTVPNPAQQLADVLLRLRNQFLDARMAALMQQMCQPELGEAERLDLVRRQQELRLLKKRPLEPKIAGDTAD